MFIIRKHTHLTPTKSYAARRRRSRAQAHAHARHLRQECKLLAALPEEMPRLILGMAPGYFQVDGCALGLAPGEPAAHMVALLRKEGAARKALPLRAAAAGSRRITPIPEECWAASRATTNYSRKELDRRKEWARSRSHQYCKSVP